MKIIPLSMIKGVHPDIIKFEQELDLAPIELPGADALHASLVGLRCSRHPLSLVHRGDDRFYSVGDVTWYRWLAAHMPVDFEVAYFVVNEPDEQEIKRDVLIERLFTPQISRSESEPVKMLYAYVKGRKDIWPVHYGSNSELSRKLGVKVSKIAVRKRCKNDCC